MDDIEESLKKSFSVFAEKFFQDFEEHNKECFFDAFKKYFKDRSDFDTLLANLKEEAKSKIIRLGFFYHIITKEIGHAGITLISIFSIMEATAPNKFRTFDQWLLAKLKRGGNISFPIADRDCFKKAILSFQKEYFKKYGSSERVRRFINKYFCTEDKQQLIRGFQIKDKSITFDSLNFDNQIKTIVDMLYNERNAFVHLGRLPQMSDRQGKMLGYFKIKNKNTYVSIEISINKIQKMFERAFIKFLRETCAYRDREEPRSSPLPHHAAYGSVLRDSADQAESDPGEQKTE